MTKKTKKMVVPADIPGLLSSGTRILLPGKILFRPYGNMVWRRKKKAIVSSEKFAKYVDIPIYLIEDDRALAIIRLKPAKEINEKGFKKLRKFHKISEKQRKMWWPSEKTFYYYAIEIISKFNPPKKIIKPEGAYSWLDSVVFKNMDIGDPSEFKNEDLMRGHDLIHGLWCRLDASSDECIKYHILFRREILRRKLKHKIVDSLDQRSKEIERKLAKDGYRVSFDKERGLTKIEKLRPKVEPFDIESYEDDAGTIRKRGKVRCPECGEIRTIQRIDQYIRKNLTGLCKDCLGKQMSGKNHGTYKDGRWHQSNGYIGILASEVESEFQCMKDSRGYIYEHRYVMAKELGRSLEEWEQVHHLNGIKDDNRIENLEMVGGGEHLLITKMQKKIKELEENMISKPYPNFHSCRLHSPNKYDRFARTNCAAKHNGKCIDHIYGIKEGKSELQSMRYKKSIWTASSARSYCRSKGGSFEAASGKAKKEKVTRWNMALSKNFDVEQVESVPATFEYDMFDRFLGCSVKKIYQNDYLIPSPLMGTYLAGFKKILSEFKLCDCRNFTYNGREVPLVYETIKLNSKNSDDFLINGTSFYEVDGKNKLVVKVSPGWFGITISLFSTLENKAWNKELLDRVHKWAKENNFLRKEKFALNGEFLEKDLDEGWDGLILDIETKGIIMKSLVGRKDFISRGMMFIGEPGTGKTKTGRVLMNQIDSTFIWVSSKDFAKVSSIQALSLSFQLARDLAPAILFIEDIDTWLGSYTVDLLKTELDGLKRNKGVVTILTSNYPERLPDTLLDRPGRFHDIIEFKLPDKEVRGNMFESWVGKLGSYKKEIVEKTEGFSGAHMRELVDFAKIIAEEDEIKMDKALLISLDKMLAQRKLIRRIRDSAKETDVGLKK